MKFFKTLVILFILSNYNLFAQWQPDVRLTNNPAYSSTSENNAWCIAASENVVHAVWYDFREGNNEIYYKRSSDGGISWGADTRLTNNTAPSFSPSVSVSGLVVHVVWNDRRDGNYEIYYKRSTDAGISWGADTRLTNNTAHSQFSSIAVSGSIVHVVWRENNDIYYKRSTDGGTSWGSDTRLTNNIASSDGPSVSVSDSSSSGGVHVVWYDYRDGNYEIYYKRSADGGTSWGADTRLTNNSFLSTYASVAVYGSSAEGGVYVIWQDERDLNWEIYYKRSTDGGTSWGADTRLTNNTGSSLYPSIALSGSLAEGVVHVVWQDDRNGNVEIYYKRSTDGGVSFGADTRLTNNSGGSLYSFVSVSGPVVHVIWQDQRDGNEEIYYKRNPTGSLITLSLNLTSFIEGFYNQISNNMVADTARIYLRNNSSPYNIIDSSKGILNLSGTGTFNFLTAVNSTNYYLVFKHRNSLETWSNSFVSFTSGMLTYDFSNSANKAYGSNQKIIDSSPVRFAIFSGDINQDETIDASDVSEVDNDAYNSLSGYVRTDVTGDNFVDAADVSIVDNNAFNSVSVVRP